MRPETTMEGLAKLPTAFDKDGFVTAGNASGIVDGAAMLLLTTAEKAQEQGKKPLGRIVSWAIVGVDPSRMGIGPAPAIRAALKKAGMTLDDLDLIEINEAFAGQILAVVKELELDMDKLNVNGGAIALGHPLGASGTRLAAHAAQGAAAPQAAAGRRLGLHRRRPGHRHGGRGRGLIDLAGYRVVVTGGSRGIGAACCRLFARAGATVLVQYLASGVKADALLAELRADRRPAAPEDPLRRDAARARSQRLFDYVERSGAGSTAWSTTPASGSTSRWSGWTTSSSRPRSRSTSSAPSSAPARPCRLLAAVPERLDHQHQLHRRAARRGLLQPLRREQGSDDLGHQVLVHRAGAAASGSTPWPPAGWTPT